MSKVVRISDETYQLMQEFAKPFDDTPDTVIRKVLEFYASKHSNNKLKKVNFSEDEILVLDIDKPTDLTHTKVLNGSFDNENIRNWRELVSVAHKKALNKLGTVDNLKKITTANIVEGEKVDNGYKPIAGTNISMQGANANNSWSRALNIAKRLNTPIKIEFKWRDKKSAKYPNRKGVLKWEVN